MTRYEWVIIGCRGKVYQEDRAWSCWKSINIVIFWANTPRFMFKCQGGRICRAKAGKMYLKRPTVHSACTKLQEAPWGVHPGQLLLCTYACGNHRGRCEIRCIQKQGCHWPCNSKGYVFPRTRGKVKELRFSSGKGHSSQARGKVGEFCFKIPSILLVTIN